MKYTFPSLHLSSSSRQTYVILAPSFLIFWLLPYYPPPPPCVPIIFEVGQNEEEEEKQLEKYNRALVVEAGEKRRGVNIIRRKDTTAETRPHLEE